MRDRCTVCWTHGRSTHNRFRRHLIQQVKEVRDMDTTTTTVSTPPAVDYPPPAVLDGGDVAEVTLGIMKFDSVDDTQYKHS